MLQVKYVADKRAHQTEEANLINNKNCARKFSMRKLHPTHEVGDQFHPREELKTNVDPHRTTIHLEDL